MLRHQKMGRAQFTGGLEAARLRPWHINLLKDLRPSEVFFAYDTPNDWEPLEEAARLLRETEYLSRSTCRCYVLIGYPGDTFEAAEHRLQAVWDLGMCPMAMLYRDFTGKTSAEWRRFQRLWARPALIYVRQREFCRAPIEKTLEVMCN
jgi:hypothetical protein